MFMRYCGGGPGHTAHPNCEIAWGITTLTDQPQDLIHTTAEINQLNTIASASIKDDNNPELNQDIDRDEEDLLAEEYDRLEETLDNLL
jgi:hypothetical protein